MEELLRHDQIKWVLMGDHKVVYKDDLDEWLERFKETELYKRAVAKWQEKNGELPGIILSDQMAREMFQDAERDDDGALLSNPNNGED